MPWLEFHDVEQFPAVREGRVPETGVSVHHHTPATDSASIICQTACGADRNMAGIVGSRLMLVMDFWCSSSEGLMMKPLRHERELLAVD